MAAAAIAALLIVLSIFTDYNPFGWVNSTEVKLQETSISVKEINDIGELVTAEYYGEVIKSLQAVYREQKSLDLQGIYDKIRNEWIKIKQDNPTRGNWGLRRIFKKTELYESHSYDLLQNITEIEDDQDFLDYVEGHSFGAMTSQYEANYNRVVRSEVAVSREDRKKELVYLARGWVKAGLDLSEVTSIEKDSANNYVIEGAQPKILDLDINPWYIPELNIKGFEIIQSAGAKKINFNDIAILKRACKERLKEDAMERRMLEYALTNGESSLASFFALFRNDPDDPLPTVKIKISKYYFDQEYILSDNRIDSAEVVQVKNLIQSDTVARNLDREYYEDLAEQIDDLDDFVRAITEQTVNIENDPAWEEFVFDYFWNGPDEEEN
ncbi:MAG TPA: hypothetical protein DCR93_23025 [Cytophagales bacterium]|nr:hypothetical protein [Cytophagales bacterium]HAP62247.1 hypothetical protein [Cytophagales bacterium]